MTMINCLFLDYPTKPQLLRVEGEQDAIVVKCQSESRTMPEEYRRSLIYHWEVDDEQAAQIQNVTVWENQNDTIRLPSSFNNSKITCVSQEEGSSLKSEPVKVTAGYLRGKNNCSSSC